MAASPRVFISFSSGDLDLVRMLLARIKSQGVDVWDYSQRGEEIPLAHPIQQALASQIADSDYILAITSAHSVGPDTGRFTRFEVETALSLGRREQGRILPIVIAERRPDRWEGPYARLQDLARLEIAFDDARGYEEAVERICRYLGVGYTPPLLGDPRMPFTQRFAQEVRALPLSNAAYCDLARIVEQSVQKLTAGDWYEALYLLSYFLGACRYRIPDTRPYYPLILKGICEAELGRFVEAEETFLQATQNPARDANAFGGLAHLYLKTGRPHEALMAYERALRLCREGEDWEVRFNILGTRIQLGGETGDAEFLRRLDLRVLPPAEVTKIMTMRGIVAFHHGDDAEAIRIFQDMCVGGHPTPTTASYHAQALVRVGRLEEAYRLLTHEAHRFDEPALFHLLASLLVRMGKIQGALRIYQDRLCRAPVARRQYKVELARLLETTGRRAELREVCVSVLDGTAFRPPTTSEDFYYDGFANYLLGRHERARYDHERSMGFAPYYDGLAGG